MPSGPSHRSFCRCTNPRPFRRHRPVPRDRGSHAPRFVRRQSRTTTSEPIIVFAIGRGGHPKPEKAPFLDGDVDNAAPHVAGRHCRARAQLYGHCARHTAHAGGRRCNVEHVGGQAFSGRLLRCRRRHRGNKPGQRDAERQDDCWQAHVISRDSNTRPASAPPQIGEHVDGSASLVPVLALPRLRRGVGIEVASSSPAT